MTLKNKKRVNQPPLSSNKKLSREFLHVVDNKTGMILTERNVSNLTCGSGLKAYWHCHNIFPGTSHTCNHEWTSVIKDRAMKGQGCPSCSGNEVTMNNCLATNRPDLSSEWDPNKNDKSPWKVTKSSTYIANWICNKCSHPWPVSVNDRYNNKGCPSCASKVASLENNLLVEFPRISAELHPDSEIIPENTLPFSNKRAKWLCPNCSNPWTALISSRTMNNTGCHDCNANKSKHEIRIYSELKAIFPDLEIKSGVRFEKKEADIFIPNLSLVIEYDGTYYHQDINKDEQKNAFFHQIGLQVLRLRGEGLEKINQYDVITACRHKIQKIDLNNLLNAICSINDLSSSNLNCITHYIQQNNFINNDEYLKLISHMNRPEFKKSMAAYPKIVLAWGDNNKLTPLMIAHKSNNKIFLKCIFNTDHDEWLVTASDLTRTDKRRVKIKCPICYKQLNFCESDLLFTNYLQY